MFFECDHANHNQFIHKYSGNALNNGKCYDFIVCNLCLEFLTLYEKEDLSSNDMKNIINLPTSENTKTEIRKSILNNEFDQTFTNVTVRLRKV